MFLKVQGEHVVKYDVYVNILLMVPIYVMTYFCFREYTQSGNLEYPLRRINNAHYAMLQMSHGQTYFKEFAL